MPTLTEQYPEIDVFHSAKQRCTNPKNSFYKNYGGRGIKFLFTSSQQILDEIGRRPEKNRHFDRINNDGHYEPGNVRWATFHESQTNKRSKRCIDNYSDEELLAEYRKRSLIS